SRWIYVNTAREHPS
ncbi:type II/IV secretion system family protein, partial [Vibrio parahaemolyticus VPTS-2010]